MGCGMGLAFRPVAGPLYGPVQLPRLAYRPASARPPAATRGAARLIRNQAASSRKHPNPRGISVCQSQRLSHYRRPYSRHRNRFVSLGAARTSLSGSVFVESERLSHRIRPYGSGLWHSHSHRSLWHQTCRLGPGRRVRSGHLRRRHPVGSAGRLRVRRLVVAVTVTPPGRAGGAWPSGPG
jgi:hypothetical protein